MGCHLLTFAQRNTKSIAVRVTENLQIQKKRKKIEKTKQNLNKTTTTKKQLHYNLFFQHLQNLHKMKPYTPQRKTMITRGGDITRSILLVL